MYIVAIAWLYVVLMMALTAKSFFGGVMMLFGYGLLPLALLLWLTGAPQRKRRRLLREASQHGLGKPDGADSQAD